MFHSSGKRSHGLVKVALNAAALATLLSTSSAWAAVSQGGVTYAPPQKRAVGDFSADYSEYNGYSLSDNSTGASNVNVSHKAVSIGYKTTKKPVVESHVASYATATWNKGANRIPSVQTLTYHTFFGQSLPSEYGTDKSTATTLISELSKTKGLSESFRFFEIPIPVYGPVKVTVSAGAKGTASSGAFGAARTGKGTAEKSLYTTSSGLTTSGALKIWGKAVFGNEWFAQLGFEAEFTVVDFTSKFTGSSELEHNSATNVRSGAGLEGQYAVGSGSGNIQLRWEFLKKFYGGLSGNTVLASWPPLYAYTTKWADYPIIILGDAGDAW